MVLLDRTQSGAALDADVRAGPWPAASALDNSSEEVEIRVHAYIDHAVVSFIAGNETAISAWVAPQRAESIGVAVFSGLATSQVRATVDVWQLATPPPGP